MWYSDICLVSDQVIFWYMSSIRPCDILIYVWYQTMWYSDICLVSDQVIFRYLSGIRPGHIQISVWYQTMWYSSTNISPETHYLYCRTSHLRHTICIVAHLMMHYTPLIRRHWFTPCYYSHIMLHVLDSSMHNLLFISINQWLEIKGDVLDMKYNMVNIQPWP